MTTSNKVVYQNRLNDQNIPFARACGNLLTNYCWKENDAADSIHEALQKDLPLQNIYFGIDVWAQNTTKLSHPRVTYPEYGGGGTNTGVAVAKLAELGLSAGIFAPAWTFEHFPGNGRDLERTTWDGTDLPADLTCSCGDCGKRHQSNKEATIGSSARLFNAGSETFFFTDFSRAISTHGDKEKDRLFSGAPMHAQLGSQSILPVTPESLGMLSPLRHYVEDIAGRTRLVIEARELPLSATKKDPASSESNWMIPLFKFDMPADGSLRLRISYRDLSQRFHGVYFYLKVSGTIHGLTQSKCPQVDYLLDLKIGTTPRQNLRLEELGVYAGAKNAENGLRLAEVDYICIQPVASYPIPLSRYSFAVDDFVPPVSTSNCTPKGPLQTHTISNIYTSPRGEGETKHLRLYWTHASEGQPTDGMPFSSITGAFAYFWIFADDLSLGRAYVAEYVLPDTLVEKFAGCEISVKVKGVGFDGQQLATASATIKL